MKKEYAYAVAHPEHDCCRDLVTLARLYTSHADHPTLALAEAAAKDVRRIMEELS